VFLYTCITDLQYSLQKHGYKRAKQFGKGGEREESAQMFKTKYFQKKVLTKFFPFSHIRISVKTGLHFQVCRNIFKISGICSRFIWITSKCVEKWLPSCSLLQCRKNVILFMDN